MMYCGTCDRYYHDNNYRRHLNTTKHLEKNFEIKHVYKINNAVIKDINKTINNIVIKHRRLNKNACVIFKVNEIRSDNYRFLNDNAFGLRVELSLRDLFIDENNIVDVKIIFCSNKEDITYGYYMKHPRSTLETTIIKTLDKYPEKLKTLGYSKSPYYEYLQLKYYATDISSQSDVRYYVDDDWINKSFKEPDMKLKSYLKSC